MPAPDHRLTTLEVAQFVADGFLRFDALVPDDINHRIVAELGQKDNRLRDLIHLVVRSDIFLSK